MGLITITTQPSGGTYYKGATVRLYCYATTSGGTVNYSWHGNGSLSYTGSGSVCRISSDSPGSSTFVCNVTDTTGGSKSSNSASVTIRDTPKPAVTASGGGTIYRGGSVTVSCEASVTAGELTYDWQVSSTGSSWSSTGETRANMSPSSANVGTKYYRCVVTNELNEYTNSTTSETLTVTVLDTPAPTFSSTDLSDATYYRGDSPVSSFSANGNSTSGTITYTWQSSTNGSSWSNISGATGTSYTPSVANAGVTYYRCVITNRLYGYAKSATSSVATITVNDTPAPEFTSSYDVSSATYYVGQTASRLVATSTSDAGTISYRWQKSTDSSSWTDISTSSSYRPTTTEAGVSYYRCIVTNTLNGYTNSVTSGTATITVTEQPQPTITGNPSNKSCYRGDSGVSLSVSATGAGTLSYQWQSSSDYETWSNISGATGTSYSPPTSTVGVTYYRCRVTSTLGSDTKSKVSSAATVTVNDTPVPSFTDGYSIRSATYAQGDSADTLNASATSVAGTVTYNWQSKPSSGGSWTDLGVTTATYTPPTADIGETSYRCIVTNTLNGYTKTATSDEAVITVVSAEAPAPSFTSAYNVSNANYFRGASASSFNASATASAGTITYQWQSSSDGSSFSNISGATGATYTPPTSSVGTMYYRCVVTNTYNDKTATLTSNTARIVVSGPQAPSFTNQASIADATYWQGDTASTMNGTATVSQGTVSYQWQVSPNGSSSWSNISGATSATYTPPTTAVGSLYYRCVATNTLNGYTASSTSNTAHITVSAAVTPVFTQNPASATYPVNATATPLSVTYTSDTTPVAYQWQVSNDNSNWSNISGATNATYTPPTDTAGVKYYRVTVTVGNPGYTASATSGPATITVGVPDPVFLSQPEDATYNVRAQGVPMDATASAPGCEITYQWQIKYAGESDFTDIVGATKPTYVPFTAPISVTQYRCIVTASNSGESKTATSNVATITVTGGEAPIFLYTPLPSNAYEYGDPIGQLNGTATSQDTDDITYQWYWSADNVNFFPVNGATDPIYTPNPPDGGTYYYYVIATATFPDDSTATSRSNTATIAIVNAKYDFGSAWRAYLDTLKKGEYVKLARLEFLQPDGSVAFALDNNPNNRRSGSFLQSGQLTVNLQNGQRRTATVTLANLDDEYEYNVNKIWFGQLVRLSEGVRLPNGQDFYLPQGVFYIREPEEKVMPNEKSVTYHLEDKWSYLNGELFGNLDGIYEIALGTNIFTAIQSVLNMERGNGGVVDSEKPMFTDYYNERTTELPDGSVVSDLALPYTYRNDGDGGTYADIVLEMANVLAALVGYDANGRLRIDPSQDDINDSQKPVQWEFKPDAKQFLGATYTIKNSDVYNDIIVTGESLSGYGYIAGRAQNLDPSSDTNVNIIGKKTLKESAAGYYSQKQCENLAAFKLKQQTVLQKSVTIQSAQLFHINENQIVTIRRPDKEGAPMERHLVTGFTRPIAESGPMQINATSVSDFPNVTIIEPVSE